MDRLLIVCDMFPPAFAPRMGYLCKYLKRMGWEITVITEYIPDETFRMLSGNATARYVKFYKASGSVRKRLEWLWVMGLDLLFHYKDRKIIRVGSRLLRANEYRGILCSTYRAFPLFAARTLARKFNLPLVTDFRDIIEQYAADEYLSHKFRALAWLKPYIKGRLLNDRNKALKAADAVTTVSPWHVQVLKRYNPNVELIYNGFDPELFYPERIPTPRFTITYTGRLLSLAIRDPELLFIAVARLAAEGTIAPDTFRVVWYTDPESKEIIEREAGRHGIDAFMEYHDYVPADKVPRLLNESSVLLSLTNKAGDNGPKGFMTTKFFEFLAVEKPILCVRSDESYLAETIRRLNAGVAASTADEAYDFLKRHYEEWKEKGYTTVDIRRDRLAEFSRKEQAKQFARIFDKL